MAIDNKIKNILTTDLKKLSSQLVSDFSISKKTGEEIFNTTCFYNNHFDAAKFKEWIGVMRLSFPDSLPFQRQMSRLLDSKKVVDSPIEARNYVFELMEKELEEQYELFVGQMNKLISLFNSDLEWEQFLKNPEVVMRETKYSPSQRLFMQQMYHHDYFKKLSSITPVIKQDLPESLIQSALGELQLQKLGSMDAATFKNCINHLFYNEVMAASSRPSKIQMMGMAGAFKPELYSRNTIQATAEQVVKSGKGACQTFAQLGAHHLLLKMEEGKLPPMRIKMVTHEDQLGSHTFLLLDHNSDNLEDLSSCIIVDPWAVAMGNRTTNGVYSEDNYPYMGMTSNLKVFYDSGTDPIHHDRLKNIRKNFEAARSSIVSEPIISNNVANLRVSTAVSQTPISPTPVVRLAANRATFFSGSSVGVMPQSELNKEKVTSFIKSLPAIRTQFMGGASSEYDAVFKLLQKKLDTGEIKPDEAVLRAIDMVFSPSINSRSKTWTSGIDNIKAMANNLAGSLSKRTILTQHFSQADPKIINFLTAYANENAPRSNQVSSVTSGYEPLIDLLKKISTDTTIARNLLVNTVTAGTTLNQ